MVLLCPPFVHLLISRAHAGSQKATGGPHSVEGRGKAMVETWLQAVGPGEAVVEVVERAEGRVEVAAKAVPAVAKAVKAAWGGLVGSVVARAEAGEREHFPFQKG
jgi:hypothetical protein